MSQALKSPGFRGTLSVSSAPTPKPKKAPAGALPSLPRGVIHERQGALNVYRGDRDAILALPICPPDLLAGEGVQWKVARTTSLPDGRLCHVARRGRRYRLCVHPTRAQANAHAAKQRRLFFEQFAQQKRAEAQRRLDAMPQSEQAFRQEAIEGSAVLPRIFQAIIEGSFETLASGYRYDQASRDSVMSSLQAIRHTLTTGGIEFDPDRQQRMRDKLASEASAEVRHD